MVLQRIDLPYEIDYQEVVLGMMVIHYILVLEKIFKKGWDDFTIPDCMFH